MNHRRTLLTELGVFEKFTPHLPAAYKKSPYVLLANIAPRLQQQDFTLHQQALPVQVQFDPETILLRGATLQVRIRFETKRAARLPFVVD
jgi:hypothetical protein